MPLALECQPMIEAHASFDIHRDEQLLSTGSRYDANTVDINELHVGHIVYPIRASLKGQYFQRAGELYVEGFGNAFIGKGGTQGEALDDFRLQVHSRFQELLYKRPFEMTSQEKKYWKLLCSLIDETRYRNLTPIQTRQFGEVLYQQTSRPKAIKWDNGYIEQINLSLVGSSDFVTFKHGQPIEAVVERNPVTRELLSIPFVTRVTSLRRPQELEQDLNDTIGSSADYPDADWD
jgi:hypothetical protein